MKLHRISRNVILNGVSCDVIYSISRDIIHRVPDDVVRGRTSHDAHGMSGDVTLHRILGYHVM